MMHEICNKINVCYVHVVAPDLVMEIEALVSKELIYDKANGCK